MREGATTWALVVGIDEYDEPPEKIPRLQGAAADAIAAVEWLRKLGVPDNQILLHARPSAETRPRIDALGMPWKDVATEPAIWESVSRLLEVPDGTRLFVFLSGHGVWEPTTGRCFLTQEAGRNGVYTNLGIDLYINCFLKSAFKRQFLFMDGCQNLPYTREERQKFAARIHTGVPCTREAGRWLVAAYGASFDERTYEVAGRGVFTRRLLEAMDPDDPKRDWVTLDFTTGLLCVDIQQVMNPQFVDQVRRDVKAEDPTRQQTPTVEVHGMSAGAPSPVFELDSPKVVRMQMVIEPLEAAQDVDNVRLEVTDRPWWRSIQPVVAGDPIGWPVSVAVPADTAVVAQCQVRPDAPWEELQFQVQFTGKSDQVQVFRCVPRRGAGGESGVGGGSASGEDLVEQYSVKVVTPDGHQASALYDEYDTIEHSLGVSLPSVSTMTSHGDQSPWLPLGTGVQVQRHETGPEFRVQSNASLRGRVIAARWATAISDVVPDTFNVMTVVRGNELPTFGPNLRLVMPKGGAEVICGPLVSLPTVRIGPPEIPVVPIWRSGNGLTLRELEAQPARRVDPGPVEVRIDLPWGSWSKLVAAPDVGAAASVRLPRKIGTPPLRCPLKGQPKANRDYVVLGVGGRRPAASVGSVGDGGRSAMEPMEPHRASWALTAMAGDRPSGDTAVIRLGGAAWWAFPILPGRAVAVSWTKRVLRVEPLSDLVSPTWDLLVATGRLDAITEQDAVDLTNDKWFDSILGLAGAYAIYASSGWRYLAVVTENLRRVVPTGVDVDLLAMAARRGSSRSLTADDRKRLAGLADSTNVPLFRWGVSLARSLLADADLRDRAWDRLLARIEANLSPISTWTAWSAPRRSR